MNDSERRKKASLTTHAIQYGRCVLFIFQMENFLLFVCIHLKYKDGQEFFNFSDEENDEFMEMETVVRLLEVGESSLNNATT